MTEIVLYKKGSSEYLYDLRSSPSYQSFVKELKKNLSDDKEMNDVRFTRGLIIGCLHMLNGHIQYEKSQRYFNIVRLMTIIDDLYQNMRSKYHYELARIFANEAVRLLLTHYDLTTHEFYSSSDWASLHRLSAYPTESGKKVKLQRNEIVAAADNYWDVDIIFGYPENYEYVKFGGYQELKKQFYADTEVHDKHFKKGATEEAVVIIKPIGRAAYFKAQANLQSEAQVRPTKPVKRRLSYSEDKEQQSVGVRVENTESEPFDLSELLLGCCQFFDIAWPLAFFVPLVGWAYLAVRAVNGGSRLTNEQYSFFHCCCSPREEAQKEAVLKWNLTDCCFSSHIC